MQGSPSHLPALTSLTDLGKSPTTIVVTVVSTDSGRKYRLNQQSDFRFVVGTRYTIVMSESTQTHPLFLSTLSSPKDALQAPLGAFFPETTSAWSVSAAEAGKRLYAHCGNHDAMGSDLTLSIAT